MVKSAGHHRVHKRRITSLSALYTNHTLNTIMLLRFTKRLFSMIYGMLKSYQVSHILGRDFCYLNVNRTAFDKTFNSCKKV